MEDPLENLAAMFREKATLLNACLELRNLTSESCPILQKLDETLVNIKETFCMIRKEIAKGKEDLQLAQDQLHRIQTIKERVSYATENFPAGLEAQKCAMQMQKNAKPSASSAFASAIPKRKKQPSKISAVTPAEYESVPKYLKGRLPYSSLEKFIIAFNKTIAKKYAFLCIPKNQMNPKDLKKSQQFKKQETAETKGTWFCVLDDLKTYGNIVPDPSTRTMLTILRHCKRIKENHGPGPICRYVISVD